MLFELSDIISIIEIGVNILLAFLIGHFIQKSLLNSRTLKDYYIQEISKLHEEILLYLDSIDSNPFEPQLVTSWFRSKSAKANNLADAINLRYKIDCGELIRDLIQLQIEVENDVNFLANFLNNTQTSLTTLTILSIDDYRGDKAKNFHKLIGEVNDYSQIFKR